MGAAITLGVVMLSLSHLLSWLTGSQSGGRVKRTTVESGMPMLDASHKRISIAFFLVAIDFIAFDLEAAWGPRRAFPSRELPAASRRSASPSGGGLG